MEVTQGKTYLDGFTQMKAKDKNFYSLECVAWLFLDFQIFKLVLAERLKRFNLVGKLFSLNGCTALMLQGRHWRGVRAWASLEHHNPPGCRRRVLFFKIKVRPRFCRS